MFDATTGLSKMYNEVNGNKLVKNMSKDEVLSQNAKFENAKYDYKTAAKQIANKDCKQVNITYTDGTSNIVFITEDYKVSLKEFYTMFAELKGLPMQYEVATSGNKILLVAKSVEQIPIDAKDLEAPKGYKVVNIDSTLCLEAPKIAPHVESMRTAIAGILSISIDDVSIKATTTENMGFVGREEGLVAYATVLLQRQFDN
jgi:hypothetical protein